jgi:uncharacterized protein YjiS (DUF1127 family)
MRTPAFFHLPVNELAQPRPSPAWRFVRRTLSRFNAFLRAWREERVTLRLIAELDAATLRDIGVTRPDLARALRERCDEALYGPAGWRE